MRAHLALALPATGPPAAGQAGGASRSGPAQTDPNVREQVAEWEAGTLDDDAAPGLFSLALRHPGLVRDAGGDPFAPDTADGGDADRALSLDAARLAQQLDRRETLTGRFAYWCLSDPDRHVAFALGPRPLGDLARRFAAASEHAAPSTWAFESEGSREGKLVAASLGAPRVCTTDDR